MRTWIFCLQECENIQNESCDVPFMRLVRNGPGSSTALLVPENLMSSVRSVIFKEHCNGIVIED